MDIRSPPCINYALYRKGQAGLFKCGRLVYDSLFIANTLVNQNNLPGTDMKAYL